MTKGEAWVQNLQDNHTIKKTIKESVLPLTQVGVTNRKKSLWLHLNVKEHDRASQALRARKEKFHGMKGKIFYNIK